MAVSNDERIKKIDEKMAQLKAQKQAIQARKRTQEEKARTRRLIQNGALAEQFLNAKEMPPEDFKKYLEYIANNPAFSSVLDKAKNNMEQQKKEATK